MRNSDLSALDLPPYQLGHLLNSVLSSQVYHALHCPPRSRNGQRHASLPQARSEWPHSSPHRHIYPCSEILRRLVTSLSSALHTIERRLNVIMPSLSSLCTVHGLLHRRLCSETCLLSAHSCVSKYARTRRSCTRGTRSAQYAIERSRMTRTPPARECLVSALYPGEENGSCAGRERKHPTLASTRGHLAQGAARDHVAPMPRHTSASHVGRSVDCQLIAKPTPWVCRA